MNITEIKSKYSFVDTGSFPGDNELRHKLFAPLFNNLYESKVIYREIFIGIVKLEDVRITKETFCTKAVPQLLLERESRFDKYFFDRTWEFSSIWSHIRLTTGDSLNSPYANWSIWCDPETVKKAEELILKKEFAKALALLEKS